MDLLGAATAQFEDVVASVLPDAWGYPTPCDLTVREVVDHVVAGNIFATRLLAGASTAEAVAGLEDYAGADPLVEVSTSCAGQLSAFATADEGRELHHPIGDISLETFLRFRLGELVVHAWDVAVGARLDPSLDREIVEGLWVIVAPHLDQMRSMGAYGNGASSDLPPAASSQTRLLDAFGRRP